MPLLTGAVLLGGGNVIDPDAVLNLVGGGSKVERDCGVAGAEEDGDDGNSPSDSSRTLGGGTGADGCGLRAGGGGAAFVGEVKDMLLGRGGGGGGARAGVDVTSLGGVCDTLRGGIKGGALAVGGELLLGEIAGGGRKGAAGGLAVRAGGGLRAGIEGAVGASDVGLDEVDGMLGAGRAGTVGAGRDGRLGVGRLGVTGGLGVDFAGVGAVGTSVSRLGIAGGLPNAGGFATMLWITIIS
jgi:hypothetical protein